VTTPTPYSPGTARALAMGASEFGYIEGTSPTWDDEVVTWNLKSVEERLTVLAMDQRDNLAALRADLKPTTGTIKIMCVGDSITSGAGSSDGTGYRPWLADLVARRHTSAALSVCAYPGQTLRYVAPIAIGQLPTDQPDIVLVHLGTNDAMQGDTADFQTRYGQFIDQILASSPTVRVACARINLSRPTTLSATESTLNTAIDAAVSARKSTGRVVSADMTGIPYRWTGDGVHPLDAGYLRMAQQWTAAIAPWLPAQ